MCSRELGRHSNHNAYVINCVGHGVALVNLEQRTGWHDGRGMDHPSNALNSVPPCLVSDPTYLAYHGFAAQREHVSRGIFRQMFTPIFSALREAIIHAELGC